MRNALAVGEVKKWDTPLGKKRQGAPTFDNNNPSYQIDYYLRATDLEWGILSNGRLWRLVHKDSSYKLEADLRDNAYKALEHLIQGFIEPSANGLTVEDLPAIYSNSLYLLF